MKEAIGDVAQHIVLSPSTQLAKSILVKAARVRRRVHGLNPLAVEAAMEQSVSAIASISSLCKVWHASRWSLLRNLSSIASVLMAVQRHLLSVIAIIFHGLFNGERGEDGACPQSYFIDHHKFDETRHFVGGDRKSSASKHLRARRHAPSAAWQILVARRVLRWRVADFPEYELELVLPPQLLKSSAAAALWQARKSCMVSQSDNRVAEIVRDVDVKFAIYEVDSASFNKMFLAHQLVKERAIGIIVCWVWCTLHLNHSIQGIILRTVNGGMSLMGALYSGSLLLRTGVNWLRTCGALHEVVAHRLDIRRGAPPASARLHASLLIAFVSEGLGGLGEKD